MARYPRQTFPGVALHVIQRGNNRSACFREDADYLTYLTYLRHLSGKYGCDVHAYCLMTNHVHLLRSYVPYFNRRYGRSGTLWEGRFRSCLAESARYVLACYRYIEQNPVRAGMAARVEGYPWSSYPGNSGMRRDPLLKPHAEYLALGNDGTARFSPYQALFDRALEPSMLHSIRQAAQGGYPLVSESFRSAALEPAGLRTERGKPGPRVEAPRALYACEPAEPAQAS
jgi:putative transposase